MCAERMTIEEFVALVDDAMNRNDAEALDALVDIGLAFTDLPGTIIWLESEDEDVSG